MNERTEKSTFPGNSISSCCIPLESDIPQFPTTQNIEDWKTSQRFKVVYSGICVYTRHDTMQTDSER